MGVGGCGQVLNMKTKNKECLFETQKEWEVIEGWILIGDFKMEDAAEGVKWSFLRKALLKKRLNIWKAEKLFVVVLVEC